MDKYFDDIEAYLFGHLSNKRRADFEARLATDPALAAALQQHRAEHEAMRQLRREALRDQMHQWKAGGESPAPMMARLGHRPWLIFAVAASFALIAAWLFLWPNPLPNGKTLAMSHYPVWEETRRGGDIWMGSQSGAAPETERLAMASERLRQGDSSGLVLLDALTHSTPGAAMIPLFKADFYARQGQFDLALETLRPILQAPDKDLREKAAWRMTLAYLAVDGSQGPRFRTALNDILQAGEEHVFFKEAQTLQSLLR